MTGRELMTLRLYQNKSLETVARECGLTVAQLVAIEQSDGVVPAKAQQQYQAVKLPRGPSSNRGQG